MSAKSEMFLILSEFSDIMEETSALAEVDRGLALTALSTMTEELQLLTQKISEDSSASGADSKDLPLL